MQARFRGKYQYTIDAKGRVNIPSKFRRVISPAAQETMVITRGTEGCLFVYPLDIWEKFEELLGKMPLTQKNTRFKRSLQDSFSDSVLDKQGRITLTPEQIRLAEIEREVLITGNIEKIEIWNPNRYSEEITKSLEGATFNQSYYEAMESLRQSANGGE